MTVKADYIRAGVGAQEFLLNPAFTVTEMVVDGHQINPASVMTPVAVPFVDGYVANDYRLTQFTTSLHIEYTGTLSGSTGSTRYATETIGPDFTFLRWETFCYPLFSPASGLADALNVPIDLSMSVEVPTGYSVQFSSDTQSTQDLGNRTTVFTTAAKMNLGSFAAAIAQFQDAHLASGDYYLLSTTDMSAAVKTIDPVMNQAYQFLDQTYGARTFTMKLRVVQIPSSLGSFAVTDQHMAFDETISYADPTSLQPLIHEFIHLGWNPMPPADSSVQQSRFFDEALTVYLTYRTMASIVGDLSAASELAGFTNLRGYAVADLAPIKDWGVQGQGDLSYTIGALCLFKLSRLMGVAAFDAATRQYLTDYQATPVDFAKFCAEYESHSDNPQQVQQFFQTWIYSTAYTSQISLTN